MSPTSSVAASVRNGGRNTALHGVHYQCFFNLVRSSAAAQSSTSVTGRLILSPSVAKAMLISIETTEGESSDPARENAATDSPMCLFPTDACANFSWTLPDVALLVSMARLG